MAGALRPLRWAPVSAEPLDQGLGRERRTLLLNGGPLDGAAATVPGPEDGAPAALLLSQIGGVWHAYQLVQTNADRPYELSHLGRVDRLPSLVTD